MTAVLLLSIAFSILSLLTHWSLSLLLQVSLLNDIFLAIYTLGILAQFTGPSSGPGKKYISLHVLATLAHRGLWHRATDPLILSVDPISDLAWPAVASFLLTVISIYSFFAHFRDLAQHFERRPALADFDRALIHLLGAGFVAFLSPFGILISVALGPLTLLFAVLGFTAMFARFALPGVLRFCEGLDFLSNHLYRYQADVVLPTRSTAVASIPALPNQSDLVAKTRAERLAEAEVLARAALESCPTVERPKALRHLAGILKEQERYEEAADLLKELQPVRVAPPPRKKPVGQLNPADYYAVVAMPQGGEVGITRGEFETRGKFRETKTWHASLQMPGNTVATFHPEKQPIDWLYVYRSIEQNPAVPSVLTRRIAYGLLSRHHSRPAPWGAGLRAACSLPTSDGGRISVEELSGQSIPFLSLQLPVRERGVLTDGWDLQGLGALGIPLAAHPANAFLGNQTAAVAPFVAGWGLRPELRPAQILLELLVKPSTSASQLVEQMGERQRLMSECLVLLEKNAAPPRSELRAIWDQAVRLVGPDRCLASEHLLLALATSKNEAQTMLPTNLRDGLSALVEKERLQDLQALESLCSKPSLWILSQRLISQLRASDLAAAEQTWQSADREEDPALYLWTQAWLQHARGEHQAAASSLEESYRLRPGLEVGLDLIHQLQANGRSEQAQQALSRLEQDIPGDAPAKWITRALLNSDPQSALEQCEKAFPSPYCPLSVYSVRSRLYERLGKTEEARQEMERLSQLAPGHLTPEVR
jgi:tetratricopeptide (TPR) repeat protein